MIRGRIVSIALVLIVLCLFINVPVAANDPQKKVITFILRYDDYSVDSNTELEVKLLDALQKYNIPATFAVIPYIYEEASPGSPPQPLSQAKADMLKVAMKADILEVAQHGYTHQPNSPQGNATEFAGLDYASQRQKIAEGKTFLEGILNTKIATFVPPYNSYDLNTLQALEDLGFNTISASTNGIAQKASRLTFLPKTCGILDIQKAVIDARQDNQPIIIVLFHPTDFREVDTKNGVITFDEFDAVLKWVVSQKDVRVSTISQAAQTLGDLGVSRYESYKGIFSSLIYPVTPPFLTPKFDYYPTPSLVDSVKAKMWLFSSLFYLAILAALTAATYFIGYFVFRRARYLYHFARYGSLLVLGGFLIYAFRNLSIHFKGATVLACILGICVGIWLSTSLAGRVKSLADQ